MAEFRDKLTQDRKSITLLRAPLTTLKHFIIVIVEQIARLYLYLVTHQSVLILSTLLIVLVAALKLVRGPHEEVGSTALSQLAFVLTLYHRAPVRGRNREISDDGRLVGGAWDRVFDRSWKWFAHLPIVFNAAYLPRYTLRRQMQHARFQP